MARTVEVRRQTKETEVRLELDMDGGGPNSVESGVPFLDHLLSAMSHHGGFRLSLRARGDLAVDPHHLVEDVGIVLGLALAETVDRHGAVARFGWSLVPMDEALAETVVDVCGRPTCVFGASFPQPAVGGFDLALLREFATGLVSTAKISLHLTVRCGDNSHHMAEALFKSLGKTLGQAYRSAGGGAEGMSTKGAVSFA
jgi:imidazoleglycerol-phosphate dehydratase